MKQSLLILAALIIGLIGGLHLAIFTAQPGYDDGYYLISICGQTWEYADDYYIKDVEPVWTLAQE